MQRRGVKPSEGVLGGAHVGLLELVPALVGADDAAQGPGDARPGDKPGRPSRAAYRRSPGRGSGRRRPPQGQQRLHPRALRYRRAPRPIGLWPLGVTPVPGRPPRRWPPPPLASPAPPLGSASTGSRPGHPARQPPGAIRPSLASQARASARSHREMFRFTTSPPLGR